MKRKASMIVPSSAVPGTSKGTLFIYRDRPLRVANPDEALLARVRKMVARELTAPVVRRSANPIIMSDLP